MCAIFHLYTNREQTKRSVNQMLDAKVIGQNLTRLRGEKSQNEVAEAVEVSRSAMSMYENGERIPRDEVKVKLAHYYGVSIEELFYTH